VGTRERARSKRVAMDLDQDAAASVLDQDGKEESSSSIPRELECAICLRLLLEPITVSCGHNFCRPCLAKAREHRPVCPLCRRPTGSNANINKLLSQLIQTHYPAEYEARKADHIREEETADEESRANRAASAQSQSQAAIALLPVIGSSVCPSPLFPGESAILNLPPRWQSLVNHAVEGSLRFGMVSSGWADVINQQQPEVGPAAPEPPAENIQQQQGAAEGLRQRHAAASSSAAAGAAGTGPASAAQAPASWREAPDRLGMLVEIQATSIYDGGIRLRVRGLFRFQLALRGESAASSAASSSDSLSFGQVDVMPHEIDGNYPVGRTTPMFDVPLEHVPAPSPSEEDQDCAEGSPSGFAGAADLARKLSQLVDAHMANLGTSARIRLERKFGPLPHPRWSTSVDLENYSFAIAHRVEASGAQRWQWLRGTSTIDRLQDLTDRFERARRGTLVFAIDEPNTVLAALRFDDARSSALLLLALVLVLIGRFIWMQNVRTQFIEYEYY